MVARRTPRPCLTRSDASEAPSYKRDAALLELGERFGVRAAGAEEQPLVEAFGGEAGAQFTDGATVDFAFAGTERDRAPASRRRRAGACRPSR